MAVLAVLVAQLAVVVQFVSLDKQVAVAADVVLAACKQVAVLDIVSGVLAAVVVVVAQLQLQVVEQRWGWFVPRDGIGLWVESGVGNRELPVVAAAAEQELFAGQLVAMVAQQLE